MILFTKGNLFESNAEALVNTVNTEGVMGKGIALQFKETYPDNYRLYRKACKENKVQVGKMFVTIEQTWHAIQSILQNCGKKLFLFANFFHIARQFKSCLVVFV